MDQRRHIGRGPGTDRFGVGEETGQVRGVLLRLQAQGTADDDHRLLPGECAHGVKGPVGETGHQTKGIAGGDIAGVILPGGDIGEGLAALLRQTEEPAHDHTGVSPRNLVVGLKKPKAHPLDHIFLGPESDGLTAPMVGSIQIDPAGRAGIKRQRDSTENKGEDKTKPLRPFPRHVPASPFPPKKAAGDARRSGTGPGELIAASFTKNLHNDSSTVQTENQDAVVKKV